MEGRSTAGGNRKWRIIAGTNLNRVDARVEASIRDDLPLSLEVADWALVGRSVLVGANWRSAPARIEPCHDMVKAQKRMKGSPSYGDNAVAGENHGQQKLIRTLTHQDPGASNCNEQSSF